VKDNGVTFGRIAATQMLCARSEETVRLFRGALTGTSHWSLVAGRLELYGATGRPLAVFEPRQAAPRAAATLSGTSWQLVKFQGGDERTLTPDDRTKYTIEFATDGGVVARLDCNRGRGTWKATGPQLELGPLALTRAKCPEGSLHDQIARQWESIRSFVLRDGHLFLSLMADGGIYEFEPLESRRPQRGG
jgi:heat shock protein HslJ